MAWIIDRLRAVMIILVVFGIVLLDSVSRIISMCVDGFLALVLVALVWPMLKKATAKQ
ncbi:hypothetical protein CNR34_00162 [Pseudomonas phage nickie]|uniref:DUF3927 domain-containing protein n=1 Tax=Pseudomonas phage nickie TaxID=2048977 RepID=A0A2H4P7C5_9CAUD|nr:hypothetical protein FDJ16_gp004 [Pseudomonas phage nickie]ATW58094.1 hypothetical protein CNR34_00162 [Pseudomonas phage nickie]